MSWRERLINHVEQVEHVGRREFELEFEFESGIGVFSCELGVVSYELWERLSNMLT